MFAFSSPHDRIAAMAFPVPTNVPIPSSSPSPSKDILWKQYELHVGLYKGYLELVLKFNVFYYAATGALISYYFSKPDIPWMKYSLGFPILMSFCFAGLFFYGASCTHVVRQELFDIRDKLGLDTAPEYKVLAVLLWISAAMMLIVAVCLVVMIFSMNPTTGGTTKALGV
jgi:hypothetical protein